MAFTPKTLELIVSKTAGISDTLGKISPLISQLRELVSTCHKESEGNPLEEIDVDTWKRWLDMYVEVLNYIEKL